MKPGLLSPALPETFPRHPPRAPLVERVAAWSARHRLVAVLGWLALVAGTFVTGHLLGTQNQPQYDPGQSGVAERMLADLGVSSPPSETVLIQPRLGAGRDAGLSLARGAGADARAGASAASSAVVHAHMRQAAAQVVTALRGLPQDASAIRSPLTPAGAQLTSRDGHSMIVTFQVGGPRASADSRVSADLAAVAAVQARHLDLTVAEAGAASMDRAANAMLSGDFRKAETTSVPITLLLLLGVFGALIAAGIPILLAVSSVMIAISLLAVPSHWLPIGQGTSEIVLIIGMAVGVDYTLFYLRRQREERTRGATLAEAIRISAGTSGRAIVVSGLTVMISLAGLLLTGVDVFTGMAIGTITVVGVAVIGSLTFLPALLSLLGSWADRGRIPFLGRSRTHARPSRLWGALVSRVVRRPWLWGGVTAAALVALALPALGMRTGAPPIDLPTNMPVVRTLGAIQHAFPGNPAPAQVVVSGQGVNSPAMGRALAALRAEAAHGGAIASPVSAVPVAHGHGMVVSVPLGQRPQAGLVALRDHILPATLGSVHGVSYAVGGAAANSYDFNAALHSAAPVVFAVVAVLAFLLLLVAFRSIAIPLISIGLNLLSVGSAYGLITLIFQQGRLRGLLGFTPFGGIVNWVPLFMFVFLFGLSMDYHVFILSRIRELRSEGRSTPDAVVGGISSSAGVVTSAAVIMVAVFSIFATLSTIDLKTVGVGLAFAVLLDATAVRGILVPAALAALGDRSWRLPLWLEWLPGRWRLDAPARPAGAPLAQHGAPLGPEGERLASAGERHSPIASPLAIAPLIVIKEEVSLGEHRSLDHDQRGARDQGAGVVG